MAVDAPELQPQGRASKIAALGRSPWGYVLASLALLIPCYWQPRIEAGDLSSHIYNSWLAQLVESGKLQGLTVSKQATNVLFDLILSGLFRALGPEAAQRIAVSLAVLIFAWGAFAFASAASGRRAWGLMPCIAMLAYGWVFHMGFFDFYIGLGLCFWALALAWVPDRKRLGAAGVVFVLAFLAHALAFAWGFGLAVFLLAANRLPVARRTMLTAVAVGVMLLGRIIVSNSLTTRWSPGQFTLTTGADQLRVFDGKYYALFIALLVVWGAWFIQLMRQMGPRKVGTSLTFQFFVLSAAAVAILPGMVLIPGYRHGLVYIGERMSLGVAVSVCALLAQTRPRVFPRYALALVTVAFFGFLYRDERIFNAFEQRMQDIVMRLPANQRVLSGVDDPTLRVNALTHMIDRVCIGHCYSYANYEPSTWQFRVRAVAPNPYVASTYEDSFALQTGQYVVKPDDLPLYQVTTDEAFNLRVVNLRPGAPNGMEFKLWKILPDLL
jgi:hypothetical protein